MTTKDPIHPECDWNLKVPSTLSEHDAEAPKPKSPARLAAVASFDACANSSTPGRRASDEALRMRLLQKAEPSERSAAIKKWLRSPGDGMPEQQAVETFPAQDLFSNPSHRM
jgi:hypothetical protein